MKYSVRPRNWGDYLQSFHDSFERCVHIFSNTGHLRVIDDLEHLLGLGDGHDNGMVILLENDHVAGQQETYAQLSAQGLMGERRIAGSENAIISKIDIQLLFQGRLNVYLRENSEAFLFQGFSDSLNRIFKVGFFRALVYP